MSEVNEVSKAKLEVTAKRMLDDMAGQVSDSLICAGNLRGEVGAQQRCVLTVGEAKLGVTITVTSVSGTDIGFEAQVDETPMA